MMIEQIQSFPDTTITLLNGRKLVVKDPEKEVVGKIDRFFMNVGLIGARAGEKDE